MEGTQYIVRLVPCTVTSKRLKLKAMLFQLESRTTLRHTNADVTHSTDAQRATGMAAELME
mgnify:CR=1 FL=1